MKDLNVSSDLSKSDYIERVCSSLFPDVVDLSSRSRQIWLRSYVSELVDEDAPKITERSPSASKLRAVISSSAARTAQLLNVAAAGEDAGVDNRTAESYLQLLEDLGVIVRVPAWHNKRLKRLVKAPKVHITDSGLAAHLLSADETVLATDSRLVGQLFETFIAGEIISHAETSSKPTEVFHFRDQRGKEVDLILEQGNKIVGIEVKSGTRVSIDDAKGLIHLRDTLGENFVQGIILHTGKQTRTLSDRIVASPISSLWQTRD